MIAENLFRTVDHPSWHRRHRPNLGREQYVQNRLSCHCGAGEKLFLVAARTFV